MSRLEFSIDRLIKEVQKRKLLYDTSVAEYRDKKAKELEWVEVCREVCTTNTEIQDWSNLSETEKTDFLIEVKKKWTSLRDCFKREQRLFEKNKHNKRKYLFFDKLRFLEPFNRPRGPSKDTNTTEVKNIIHEEIFINEDDDDGIKQEILDNDTDSDEVDENPLSKLVGCKSNNMVKILTPQEISSIRGNTFMIIENNELNKISRGDEEKDFEKRKRKREIDKNNDDYQKNKLVVREYTENTGEPSGCNEIKRETNDNKGKGYDDDQAFLKSILPTFKALNTEQKFRLRIEIMQTILKFKVDNRIAN